jgi:hypothetical protein
LQTNKARMMVVIDCQQYIMQLSLGTTIPIKSDAIYKKTSKW